MENSPFAANFNLDALFKISYGLYIISTKSGSSMNGFISNAVFQITAEPPQFAICCSKNNHSAEMISQSGMFTVSVLKQDAGQELISLFGYRSGRDVDKFSGTEYIMTGSGVPAVTQDSLAWFECSVNQSVDVGTHILFTGRILNGVITDSGSEPLTYAWYREQRKGKAPKNAPTYREEDNSDAGKNTAVKYRCVVCGHVYDPAIGDPDNGIPAGTEFSDLPGNWKCPVCGAGKDDFEAII